MNNNISITALGLEKSYKKTIALKDISFEVKKNEIFGFIGPDGAGKTSLFRILVSLYKPDKGSAHIEGLDVIKDYKQIRNYIGYMPGRFSLYQDLTVEENLNFFATIFNTTIEENYHLIKSIYSQIEPFKNRKAGALSGGMKQKLALSCALIHKPKVLILDEPTTGVDAVSRKEFWDMLNELKSEDISIVVSTPYMDEAALCDRIALMQSGEILSIDSPKNIIDSYQYPLFSISAKNNYNLLKFLEEYQNTNSAYLFGQTVHYTSKKKFENTELENILIKAGHSNIVIKKIAPSIEDCFLSLTNNQNHTDNNE